MNKLEIDVVLDEIEEMAVELDSTAHAVATDDHNKLFNRDLANQHPIESITGLSEELSDLKEKVEDLSLKPAVQSYNDLTDKPSINDVELVGNKTHTELKVSPIDDIELEAILTVD